MPPYPADRDSSVPAGTATPGRPGVFHLEARFEAGEGGVGGYTQPDPQKKKLYKELLNNKFNVLWFQIEIISFYIFL